MSRSSSVGLVAAVALAVSSVSCGGSASALGIVQKAYASTVDAKTSKVNVSEAVQAGAGTNLTITGDGVIDFGRHAADITFGVGGPTAGSVRFVGVGNDAWVSLPAAVTGRIPGAKPFIHQVASDSGDASSLDQVTSPDDPAATLAQLQGLSTTGVKKVGTETVRDAKTTHLKANVDMNKVAAKDPSSAQKTQLLVKMLGTNVVPVDVWVDSQNRVRRYKVSLQNLKVPNPAASQSGQAQSAPASNGQAGTGGETTASIQITEEFYDFGTPVTITPPPADQVMETAQFTALQQQSQRQAQPAAKPATP